MKGNPMLKDQDLLLRNANIITMDPQNPFAESLAIKHGRIFSVGSWEQVKSLGSGLPELDLGGKTVVPGMIDTHTHFLWTAMILGLACVHGRLAHCSP